MGFRDEINAMVKSPEQRANEQRCESINKGIRHAKRDYEELKKQIKKNAQEGEYRIVGTQKIIGIDYKYSSVFEFVSMQRASFDGIIDRGMKCIVKDEVALDTYKNELERLAKEDDITIQLMYVFKDDDGTEQCFDIPGIYSSLDKRTTCHVQARSNYVLRCSFVF